MRQIVLKENNPKARKHHHCSLCNGVIYPGVTYKRKTVIFDGGVSDWLTCSDCQDDGVWAWVWDWMGAYWDIGVGLGDAQEWADETTNFEHNRPSEYKAAKAWQERYKKGQNFEHAQRD